MPNKKPSPYKLGKVEGEIDYSEKHSICLAYINTVMHWIWRILALILASSGTIKILLKVLSD